MARSAPQSQPNTALLPKSVSPPVYSEIEMVTLPQQQLVRESPPRRFLMPSQRDLETSRDVHRPIPFWYLSQDFPLPQFARNSMCDQLFRKHSAQFAVCNRIGRNLRTTDRRLHQVHDCTVYIMAGATAPDAP